jgi:hypothetical protein
MHTENQSTACSVRFEVPEPTATLLSLLADDAAKGSGLAYARSVLGPLTGWDIRQLPAALHAALAEADALTPLQVWLRSDRTQPFACVFSHGGATFRLNVHCRSITAGEKALQTAVATCEPAENRLPQTDTPGTIPPLLDRFPAFVALIGQDYTVRYANRTFREMFGDDAYGPCYRCIHGRQSPCDVCAPFDVFETDSLTISEWEHQPTGKAFRTFAYPFALDDGSTCVLVIGLDISQSLKAQKALIHSEQRYRAITDNLATGIAVVDANGCIQAVNPKITEWFGSTISGGVFVDDLFSLIRSAAPPVPQQSPPAGTGAAQSLLLAILSGATWETELPLKSLSGERTFRIVVCPVLDSEDMAGTSVLMLDDVTERRQAEQSLQRTRKLEAMGTLAGGIAHEINQPLNALQLYASGLEMMLEKHGSIEPDVLYKRLSWILREAGKIREIIAHMRAVVMQEETPHCGPVVVEEAVRSALGLVGAQLQSHGITLQLDFGRQVPVAYGNAVQLEQVVINLVVNAMHALDSVDIAEKTITIHTAAAPKGMAMLVVEDNGPGLNGLQERIFDPFFTTKETGSGMGLGLSIVHAFIETWGGSVHAGDRPPPERGARFVILLQPAGDCHAHNDNR